MKKTIKQKILDHLNAGFTLTYGQANTITNSQSGYRRFQEILKDNPDKYRFVKVKSENGGYYNVFGLPKSIKVFGSFGRWFLIASGVIPKKVGEYKTHKEAKAHIRKVVR